ncbi:protoheme IX farnesyltransferase [Ehrlichia chaffeensis str. Heartland]|uniref:Protoheme IX farnesyltransferase n=1 Tax=Ehrlichia chaffeensis (strain ATCC CRL-10679 / Arkansas) TaxID=205920 RepID=COXX_EHRCR|nr:heme o synthase [Ehrlichia chaffeensis]Q2GFJ2.1 RecName: Full=Protoheme IX farnesyltransferase; AltName: Full=Heme B farnesyltransferase; AltName: Full=Heme O synthase [Ehrlichia chaffeensis str. Arkansas]ABD44990.1 protoheme IX farnesyltransferase [Ehrlichia chaffeensis str. Arkansas]AHX03329.1 protoheme IX farnesyltransferase [Ehrlichia chaffeensis str. Heartland]AHX05248.1 protoheme IX farnesyltransferase [Ehrlichia chaffeensis str. Jax]AHX06236.1 protoheme IX farnesyltransferase [Ehrlic
MSSKCESVKPQLVNEVLGYWDLLKPKIMYLVVLTGITGMIIAPGNIHPFIGIISTLCIALGSGAAGAINMWYDSDIDALMQRTKNRPIPSGKIARSTAIELGLVLSVISVTVMMIAVNYLSGILLAISIGFYSLVYTMYLKRRTPQNIVIGGIAGALPPIIGWTSVTNAISIESLILFLIIFVWTPPHFWALSLLNYQEYEKAKVPMLPVTHGIFTTKIYILVYSIILFIITLLPGIFLKDCLLYETCAIPLGMTFVFHAFKVFVSINHYKYKAMFTYSIAYLFILFICIIISSF